jgi:hypothetical protein
MGQTRNGWEGFSKPMRYPEGIVDFFLPLPVIFGLSSTTDGPKAKVIFPRSFQSLAVGAPGVLRFRQQEDESDGGAEGQNGQYPFYPSPSKVPSVERRTSGFKQHRREGRNHLL